MSSSNALTTIWNWVSGWVTQNAGHFLYAPIPKARTDVAYDDAPLRPMASYFRLWLAEMYLSRSRSWFVDLYPAVHSAVQLKFGSYDAVKFSNVARPPQEALGRGVLLNYPVTELMPFNGGVVEIESALLALKGANYLQLAINLLQSFSGLISAPLGQVLDIAETVSAGVQNLLALPDSGIHLALHQAFTSAGGGNASVLRPGYLAVILATAEQVDARRLSVRADQLYYQSPGGRTLPFTGYDYMLFRLEGRAERDDWRLRNIAEPLEAALSAVIAGDVEKAQAYRTVAITAAATSADLAVYDRRRVVDAIKDELAAFAQPRMDEEAERPVGAPALDWLEALQDADLGTIMRTHAMPVDEAITMGELSLDEALSDV
jgi:hypothetical protein